MFVLVNYANEPYKKAQKLNTLTAEKIGGVDKVFEFSDKDIETTYFEQHKGIFSNPRGNGLWLWKPYFILKVLKQLNDGDILFYSDSAAFFIGNIKKKITRDIEKSDCGIWISSLPLVEKQFTKKSVFLKMDCMDEKYTETNQLQATFLGFKKSERTIRFVEEWLSLCENVEMISPVGKEEDFIDSSFIAHREDQSLVSLLCKKYGVVSHRDPTQYAVVPEKYNKKGFIFRPIRYNEKAKPFAVLHRTKNNEFLVCLKQFACAILPRVISLRFIQKV